MESSKPTVHRANCSASSAPPPSLTGPQKRLLPWRNPLGQEDDITVLKLHFAPAESLGG